MPEESNESPESIPESAPESEVGNEGEPDLDDLELEEKIEVLREITDGRKTDVGGLLFILNAQVRNLVGEIRNANSELIRIRATLEDKTEEEALEEANERSQQNHQAALHNFLRAMHKYSEEPEAETPESEEKSG